LKCQREAPCFFDEIGTYLTKCRPKLLSAIQNKVIVRVGSNKAIPVDISILVLRNQTAIWEQMVIDGLFREDLLYRINTIQIEVRCLRERGDDILDIGRIFI